MSNHPHRSEYQNLVGVFRRCFPIETARISGHAGKQSTVEYCGGLFMIEGTPDKSTSGNPYSYRVFRA